MPEPNNEPDEPTISLADQKYAMDNRWANRRPAYKRVRRSDSDPLGEINNLLLAEAAHNPGEGAVNGTMARVLRIENRGTNKEGENILMSWWDSIFGSDESPRVAITAIMDCKKHATAWGQSSGVCNPKFKLPHERGQSTESLSNSIIDKFRDCYDGLFIAAQNVPSDFVPAINSKVMVQYLDAANQADGIWWPLDDTQRADPSANPGDSKNKDPCNKLKSKNPNGGSTFAANEPTLSEIFSKIRRESIDAKKDRGKKPVGKGVFTGLPDINTHPVSSAEHATLNWICYLGLSQNSDGTNFKIMETSKARTFVDAYHKKGMRTYMMASPAYGHEETFISQVVTMANEVDAIGIVINLDFYYDETQGVPPDTTYAKEKYLMTTLKKMAQKDGFSLGLTTTDLIKQPQIPWRIFSDSKTGVDFAIPLVLERSYSSLRDAEVTPEEAQEQIGPTAGVATSFDDIKISNFKQHAENFDPELVNEQFKNKWYERGFSKNTGDFHTRSVYMMAAAEVIEEYWKQAWSDAKVIITSHWREGGKGNHPTGGAFDVRIEYEGEKRVPALQTWAGLKKLQLAGRLPLGATGLYLNVSSDGIKSAAWDENAKNSKGTGALAGPGGSANPHYDMRGFTYGGGGKSKNTTWVDLDLDGDGKDQVHGNASSKKWLKENGLNDVADFIGKENGTWKTDQGSPAVGGAVRNMKQVLGLSSTSPSIPSTVGELEFVQQYKAWKKVGFTYIVPGLGMIGDSPKPDGWMPDEYNTSKKSPYRMRQEATWAFTSVKTALFGSMANVAIWWDWNGADTADPGWPEKRWDIITELGNAAATAEKLNSLDNSSMSEAEKEKIRKYKLDNFQRSSKTPGEALKEKREKESTVEKAPDSTIPSQSENPPPPEASELTTEKKKEIQADIDSKLESVKELEEQIKVLETDLRKIETTATEEQKEELGEQIKEKQEAIKTLNSEINAKRLLLKQQAVTEGDEAPPPDKEKEEASPPKKDPCPKEKGSGDADSDKARAVGQIKESQLPGVEYVDYEFTTFPLTGAGYIVIHTPGKSSGTHERLGPFLQSKGLGVHFTVDKNGKAVQHADLDVGVSHGKPLNSKSYGIEVLNTSGAWPPSKTFVPHTRAMAEQTWLLIKMITRNSTNFKIEFPTVNFKDGTFYFGNGIRKKGIIPHAAYNSNRGDGRWTVLYCALRYRGHSAGKAYNLAVAAHEKMKGSTRSERAKTGHWIEIDGLKRDTDLKKPVTQEEDEESGHIQSCPEGEEVIGSNPDGTPICAPKE